MALGMHRRWRVRVVALLHRLAELQWMALGLSNRWGYYRALPWSHLWAGSQRMALGLHRGWRVRVITLLHRLAESQRMALGLSNRWGYYRA